MLEPITCRCCGQTIHPRDNAGTGDLPLCLTCLEDRYTACARCGALIPNHQACYLPSGDDEDEPYCPDCYLTIAGQKPIHDYYYRPSPLFWGDGPFYFGVELEIDEAGEDSDNARRLLAIANQGQPTRSSRISCAVCLSGSGLPAWGSSSGPSSSTPTYCKAPWVPLRVW